MHKLIVTGQLDIPAGSFNEHKERLCRVPRLRLAKGHLEITPSSRHPLYPAVLLRVIRPISTRPLATSFRACAWFGRQSVSILHTAADGNEPATIEPGECSPGQYSRPVADNHPCRFIAYGQVDYLRVR